MRTSRIKEKLRRNEPAMTTALHLTDPSVYELTSLMGFDGIWMDVEHHAHSLETASNLMRAARVGSSDIITRPAKGEFMRMQRILEAGAQGIMYPRCDDAREAAEVVKWAKFHPLGCRGFDGGSPDMPYCTMSIEQYIKEANEQTLVVIQIEHPDAVEQVEEIAAIEGVDVLFLGPADLSIASGIPGQLEGELIKRAMRRTAEAAERAGKHWGSVTFSLEHAKRLLDMGARYINYQVDLILIKEGLERIQREFSALGLTFNNQLAQPTTDLPAIHHRPSRPTFISSPARL